MTGRKHLPVVSDVFYRCAHLFTASITRAGTELSQRELIARAFAGDDVQAEFDEAKGREAEEEAPKADAPSLLPGWGAWAGHQKTPGWMAKAQDKAQRCSAGLAGKGYTFAPTICTFVLNSPLQALSRL